MYNDWPASPQPGSEVESNHTTEITRPYFSTFQAPSIHQEQAVCLSWRWEPFWLCTCHMQWENQSWRFYWCQLEQHGHYVKWSPSLWWCSTMETCLQPGTSPSVGLNLQCLAVPTPGISANAKLSPSVCPHSPHFSVSIWKYSWIPTYVFGNLTVILPTAATYYF